MQILMSVRETMTAMKSMDYALIPMDPISVAVKWDSVVMEPRALVSEQPIF